MATLPKQDFINSFISDVVETGLVMTPLRACWLWNAAGRNGVVRNSA